MSAATDEVNFDAPVSKPKPAAKKKAKKKVSAAKPKSSVPFPGLTRTACANACNEKGCVISGTQFCGHPTKGAQINQNDREALKRLQTAREQIAVKIDPDRFKD